MLVAKLQLVGASLFLPSTTVCALMHAGGVEVFQHSVYPDLCSILLASNSSAGILATVTHRTRARCSLVAKTANRRGGMQPAHLAVHAKVQTAWGGVPPANTRTKDACVAGICAATNRHSPGVQPILRRCLMCVSAPCLGPLQMLDEHAWLIAHHVHTGLTLSMCAVSARLRIRCMTRKEVVPTGLNTVPPTMSSSCMPRTGMTVFPTQSRLFTSTVDHSTPDLRIGLGPFVLPS